MLLVDPLRSTAFIATTGFGTGWFCTLPARVPRSDRNTLFTTGTWSAPRSRSNPSARTLSAAKP
jgi:hypothetical protein